MKKYLQSLLIVLVTAAALTFTGHPALGTQVNAAQVQGETVCGYFTAADIPEYNGKPCADINDDVPFFTNEEVMSIRYEHYHNLDHLGRCTYAVAYVGEETMPTEPRGPIGMVKPSGWHTVKYDGIDGNYLYNRCHLIGYQLTGENANEQNLITGTRYLNVEGMLPFENSVADYVKGTGNHVLYRVTPIYEGDDLLCRGVLMEAQSIEDELVRFCVFCYNVQPGIEIDYRTGDSHRADEAKEETEEKEYVLNTNTKKFHYPTCDSVKKMKEKNKKTVTASREDLISSGYSPCGGCNP